MSVEFISPYPKLLLNHPYRSILFDSLTHALDTVAGDQAVMGAIRLEDDHLIIKEDIQPLNPQGKLVVVSAGKAAIAMMQGALQKLEQRIDRAIVITKKKAIISLPKTEIFYGDHPIPGRNSIRAAHRLEKFVRALSPQDTLLCMISGGASALLTYPRPPLTLRQLQQTTRLLLRSGATIQEINCIRKHLERFKGGGLAAIAQPAKIISLILSDVIDNDLASIASGMTAPDPSTFSDALQILHKYHLEQQIPSAVLQLLQKGEAGLEPETRKSHDALFQNVNNNLIGSNSQACQAALEIFSRNGFSTLHLTSFLKGEASQVGKIFAAFARQLSESSYASKPICWIAGGETTVTVRGKGIGGRNLEIALGAVKDLAGIKNCLLMTLATDGEDGVSPTAGAVVDGTTWQRASALGLDPDKFLANNDSYSFFDALGDVLYTSPTNTNVNDLILLISY